MDYLNIDLLFDRIGKKYKVRIINSPGGQGSLEFKKPFSETELENFLLKIDRPRRSTHRSISSETEAVKSFGAKLFETIFEKDTLVCLQSSLNEAKNVGKGLRLRLRLTSTPELADLPWEYLYNSSLNRFLSLSVESPIVRYLEFPERIRTLAITPPLKILVMISSPTDCDELNTELEWKKLTKALESLKQNKLVTIKRMEQPTVSSLMECLQNDKYHVFHFIGHGTFKKNLKDGFLLFEDDNRHSHLVSGEQMGALLKDHNTLRLAILNACEGARTSIIDPFAGTAQSLVQQGIPAVIAMQFPITDDAAITMTERFYSGLSKGHPVDFALAETRKVMFAGGDEVEWGTPVLYMRSPDGQLFNLEKTDDQVSTEDEIAADSNSIPVPSKISSEKNKPSRVTLEEIKKRRIKNFRISIVAIFAVTAIVTLLLNGIRVNSAEVEIQLGVSEVSFRLMENWSIFSLNANNIKISHLNDLEMEILSAEKAMDFDPETDSPLNWQQLPVDDQLKVQRTQATWGMSVESNYLNLTSLHIDSGALVTVGRDDSRQNQLNLRISDGAVFGSIDTGDTLILACSNCFIENLPQDEISKTLRIATFDNQIAFRDLDKSLQIQVDLQNKNSAKQDTELAQNLSIQSIGFTRLAGDKIVPTLVKDGTIYLTDLNNKKIDVSEGDFVLLDTPGTFRIKKLQLRDNLILTVQGETRELKTGAGSFLKSRLPSLLEWLYANQLTILIMTTIVPVLLTILAIFYRLRMIENVEGDNYEED